MAEDREADRRLPRPRLSDEAERLALGDGECHLVDDVDARACELDAEILDLEGGPAVAVHPAALPRWMPIAARANPSPIRLVPIVRRPMKTTPIVTSAMTTAPISLASDLAMTTSSGDGDATGSRTFRPASRVLTNPEDWAELQHAPHSYE